LTYVVVDYIVGHVYNLYFAMKDKKLYSLLYMVMKVCFDHIACRYFPRNTVMVIGLYGEGVGEGDRSIVWVFGLGAGTGFTGRFLVSIFKLLDNRGGDWSMLSFDILVQIQLRLKSLSILLH